MIEGNFNRAEFVKCCREYALSGRVQKHPGRRSVWIMDGARIHCHPDIVAYLRSLEIIPIFLPAYCPFYNPIEFFFGMVKKALRRHYQEGEIQAKDLPKVISRVLDTNRECSLRALFRNCGYLPSGLFDAGAAGYRREALAELGFE